jgi:tetratricopeptide (TPR) repeat protein
MDFLIYAYLQSGHEADALKVIDEVRAMPPMGDMYGMGTDMRTWALTVFQARYALELRHWGEAASLAPVQGAAAGDLAVTYWARAIGAARSGNVKQARADIKHIVAAHEAVLAKKDRELIEYTENAEKEAVAWLNFAEGKHDAALAAMRDRAEKEESTGGEADRGIPAREMLADMMLEMKRGEQALAEYKASMKFSPNRFNSLYGAARAAEMAGQSAKAGEYYALLVKLCEGSGSARPELAKAKQEVVAQK